MRTPACRPGLVITHRRYVPYSHAHYAGNLVDGAYSLGLFGDAATELCITTDEDEGLFASYSEVQFVSPVLAGDVLEVRAELVRVGSRSREIEFTASVIARGTRDVDDATDSSGSAARLLDEPLVATRARGTCVVPA
jgi:3-aminobutyryl-CoA ammonia-lyase